MTKRLFTGLLLTLWLALTLTLAGAAQAQDAPWSVLLVNTTTSQLLRIDSNGTQTPYDLGLPQFTLNRYGMSVSADGNKLAFCQYDDTDPGNPAYSLMVYDLTAGARVMVANMGFRQACLTGQYGFSPDGSLLAVGLINYINGDPNANVSLPMWEVHIYDVASATPTQRLEANSALVQNVFTTPERWTIMPDIRSFDGTKVSFVVLPWGTEAVPLSAFTWDTAAGTLVEDPIWEAGGASTLITPDGIERAFTLLDQNLAAGEPGGPMPTANSAQVLRPGQAPVTVYYNTQDIPVTTQYIDDGQALGIQLLQGFDMSKPDMIQGTYWVRVDRAGNLAPMTDLLSGFSNLVGARGGYVILTSASDPATGVYTFSLDYVANGITTPLWNNTGDTSNNFWDIAYVTPPTVPAGLPMFPAAAAPAGS